MSTSLCHYWHRLVIGRHVRRAMQESARNDRRKTITPQTNAAQDAQLFVDALMPGVSEINTNQILASGIAPCTPAAIDAAFERLIEKLLPTLESHLRSLEGLNLGDEANADLARSITRLLRRLDCSLLCPHCHKLASSLRYTQSSTPPTLVFKFEHPGGRPRHGGRHSVPELRLVRTPTLHPH